MVPLQPPSRDTTAVCVLSARASAPTIADRSSPLSSREPFSVGCAQAAGKSAEMTSRATVSVLMI
ncbi:hypothetical protein WMF39_49670 [Sorangium sp. So ce1504]|uniref:hypothetical protein n=1 Tax=Sorangium sp. So ce1504 TaxID=3133337 RepID=UPI003F607FE1